MSIPEILSTLLIGPLEVLFERIYALSYNILENPGLSIIGLSLVMNLLLLPLYKQTDAIQMEAINTEKRMKPFVDHIKKTFKGNEQFMMLQTCYRQNHYKPTDALKGLSPLVLEIPFFMAAYQFLSNLDLLQNASLGPVSNLGAPDGLLVLGGLTINVLPILMTVINVVSSLIYTREAPLKTKIQLYGMAALFLVLLYDSPAGLAFYWTLNNLFSLIKNMLMKAKKPMLIVSVFSAAAAVTCIILVAVNCISYGQVKSTEIGVVAILLLLPGIVLICRQKGLFREKKPVVITGKNKTSFVLAGMMMTVLVGVLIPAALLHTSPEEFIVKGTNINPVSYIRFTGLICAGFFMIWLNLFYFLAKPSGKKAMEIVMWLACGISLADYMWFGKKYGILSNQLTYEAAIKNSAGPIFLNLAVVVLVAALIYLIWVKKPDILRVAGIASLIAMAGMSAVNLVESNKIIENKMDQMETPSVQVDSLFELSKTGKNVVILMLDRGASGFVPYIMAEKPEIQEQFAGFTYYPNTISFGSHTNFGLPAVFGGYEYTPLEINRRNTERLETKHNEALKVLPVMFSEEGYDTTVCDPTYAGYDWYPDLSIFDDYPRIKAHITMGHYHTLDDDTPAVTPETMQRKFLSYSVFKTAPVFLHEYLYDSGAYLSVGNPAKQFSESLTRGYGIDDAFRDSYTVLDNLPGLTKITERKKNTFMMMCNDTTHSPQLLQMPDYKPMMNVDNSAYESRNPERTDAEGNRIVMKKPVQVEHYHCNMASFLEIGQWLDYLRENNVYDNTRIIIAADHGYFLHLDPELEIGSGWDDDIMYYNPVLLVKDFDSNDAFRTDETMMTSADVPTLTTDGLIKNPVNPFTGNRINSFPKDEGTFYVFASHQWDVAKNNGTTFAEDRWLKVHGDIKDKNSWTYIDQDQLPQN